MKKMKLVNRLGPKTFVTFITLGRNVQNVNL